MQGNATEFKCISTHACDVKRDRNAQGADEQPDDEVVLAASGSGFVAGSINIPFELHAVRCDFKNPRDDQCQYESRQDEEDVDPKERLWCAKCRKKH